LIYFILIVSIIIIIFWKLYSPKIKGIIGEKSISSILYLLDKSKYSVINNIVLKRDTKTSQIDHVVISDFGIFVIETKTTKVGLLATKNQSIGHKCYSKEKRDFIIP